LTNQQKKHKKKGIFLFNLISRQGDGNYEEEFINKNPLSVPSRGGLFYFKGTGINKKYIKIGAKRGRMYEDGRLGG
jgi:hypothetical protein